jgi:hypothetical protein
MPTPNDSLRRARREREAALARGDREVVGILDQAIAQLVDMIGAEAAEAPGASDST